MNSENFVVSARKYRPQTFDTVVGQSVITSTLKNAILRKHLAHAYLFCGPRGVGKTTCARIFAKTINCLSPTADAEACNACESCRSFDEQRSYSIHELDAASNNSVEDIRQLTEQVRIAPQIGKYSVYIIDEVHMLSQQAFNAFLKTLEEPPANAIFILATTEKPKILPTILSRCQIYNFKRIEINDTVEYLKKIAAHEKIVSEEKALYVIAQKADGAMRDALSIFDQLVSFCGEELTYEKVIEILNILDYDYYFRFTKAFAAHDYTEALLLFNSIMALGFDALSLLSGLSLHFRNLLVSRSERTIKLMETSESVQKQYLEQAAAVSPEFLLAALNIVEQCIATYRQSAHQRFHVELCMLNLSYIGVEKKNSEPIAAVAVPTAAASASPSAAAVPQPLPQVQERKAGNVSIKDMMQKNSSANNVPAAPSQSPLPSVQRQPAIAGENAAAPAGIAEERFQRLAEKNDALNLLREKLNLKIE